jgi:hypothetical protein
MDKYTTIRFYEGLRRDADDLEAMATRHEQLLPALASEDLRRSIRDQITGLRAQARALRALADLN